MSSRTASTSFENVFRIPSSSFGKPSKKDIIEVDNIYRICSVESDNPSRFKIRPVDITQRNWSRVGTASLAATDVATSSCFVKQYIDRSGVRHPDHWQYEYEGALLAREILGAIVTVPMLLLQDEQRLLNIFEHVELITVDELLRQDETRFWKFYPLLLEQFSDVLQAMKHGVQHELAAGLPVKQRSYASQGLAINFKGFEIRNTGYQLPLDGGTGGGISLPPVVMFDFVRPYLAPIEEAAAKLLVSIALLNWGKPLSRFIKGHDAEMLDTAFYYIGQWTNRAAMEAELAIQEGFRFDTIKGASRSESQLKKAGLNLIGRRYLSRVRDWTMAHFPGE